MIIRKLIEEYINRPELLNPSEAEVELQVAWVVVITSIPTITLILWLLLKSN